MTQAVIADEMGVSQSQVSDYLSLKNRPGVLARSKGAQSRRLRIPERWWKSPAEGGPSPIPAAKGGRSAETTQATRAGEVSS